MKIITPSLCGLAFLAAVAVSPHVSAAEFTCEPERYNCLYDSVAAANQTSGSDIIRFSAGVHYSIWSYNVCAPAIVGDITIVGTGRDLTSLIAYGSCAFFQVPAGSSLTLRDIGIHNGYLVGTRPGREGVQRGAAVHNKGRLRVERSLFRGNGIVESTDSLSGGGAIYNAPHAKAYFTDTVFQENHVGPKNYGGAAILNEGTMTVSRSRFFENGTGSIILNGIPGVSPNAPLVISDSIIDNNVMSTGIKNNAQLLVERTTISGGDAFEGGGIYNASEMTVRESTILRNTAIRGGGVYSATNAKSTFINTTITQNHARGKAEGNGIGGGVFNYGGTVYLANSTIVSNTSQGLGSAIAATSDADGSAQVYTKSSLIVGHAKTTIDQSCYDFGPNDSQKLFLVENNLITEESNCYAPSDTDVIVKDAITFTEVIGPLADYGSPTPSYALLPGSPAIDHEDKLCTDFDGMPIVIDQRGKVRTGCDKGAVDSTGAIPPIAIKLKLAGNPPTVQLNTTSSIDLAILSRADSNNPFHPISGVDRSSLRLGSAGAVPYKFISQDINGDGIADLVLRFKVTDFGLACGDTAIVELRGAIIKGAKFVSRTAISATACGAR